MDYLVDEIALPRVFVDGSNVEWGTCRVVDDLFHMYASDFQG